MICNIRHLLKLFLLSFVFSSALDNKTCKLLLNPNALTDLKYDIKKVKNVDTKTTK